MTLLALCGCAGMFGGDGIPYDPLFRNGKPREAKCVIGPPGITPFTEPSVPENNHVVQPH